MHKVLLAILVLSLPLSLNAQTLSSCDVSPVPVTIRLESELTSTVPSASVGIYADMENTGAENISDSSIAVDVIRSEDGAVVDRFVVPQRVAIFGESSAKIGFIWKVPAGLSSGTYTVVATLAPADATRAQVFAHVRYPTARLDITLMSDASAKVAVRSLLINGQLYEPWTVAQISSGSVSTSVQAQNVASAPYVGTFRWRLYAADARLDAAPLEETSPKLELHPSRAADAVYKLPPSDTESYYLEGMLDGGSPQYVDLLLARGASVFSWASCTPSARAQAKAGARLYGGAALAIALAAGIWYFVRRRSAVRG